MKVEFEKIDFGLLTVTLTALGLGVVLYFFTAPFWNDGPPLPQFFVLNRLTWFPICEIACLICFTISYKIFHYPKLGNVVKLFLSCAFATNISVFIALIGSEFYKTGNITFERYSQDFTLTLLLIGAFNIVSVFNFFCSWIFSFIVEKIFTVQKLN